MTAYKQPRLTPTQVAALRPCSDRTHVFGTRKRMTARQAIKAGVPVADLLWVAAALGRKDICVRFALECAQRVANLSSDPLVQAAIDAARAWAEDPSEKNRAAAAAARWPAAAGAARWAAAAAAAAAAARWPAAAGGAAGAAARWTAAAAGAARWAAAAAAAAGGAAAAAAELEAQTAIFLRIVETGQ